MSAPLLPAAAGAQRGIELGPFVAIYAPVGSYRHEAPYFRAGTPDDPRDNRGLAWGAQGRIWVSRRFGLEVRGAVSSARRVGYTPAGPRYDTSRVLSVTAQALYKISPTSAKSALWLGAGGGGIRHSGSSYAPYGSPTHAVGAFGVGSSVPLGRRIVASLGVTGFGYHFAVSDSAGSYQRGWQQDLLAHAGVAVSLH